MHFKIEVYTCVIINNINYKSEANRSCMSPYFLLVVLLQIKWLINYTDWIRLDLFYFFYLSSVLCNICECFTYPSHLHLRWIVTIFDLWPVPLAPITVPYDGPVCDSRYCPSLPFFFPASPHSPILIPPSPPTQRQTSPPSCGLTEASFI